MESRDRFKTSAQALATASYEFFQTQEAELEGFNEFFASKKNKEPFLSRGQIGPTNFLNLNSFRKVLGLIPWSFITTTILGGFFLGGWSFLICKNCKESSFKGITLEPWK